MAQQPKPLPSGSVDAIPMAVGLLGALVASTPVGPGRRFESHRAFKDAASTLAQGSEKDKWHLVNAAVAVVHTLRDTFAEVTGGVRFTFAQPDTPVHRLTVDLGTPAEAAGEHQVEMMQWLNAPSGLRPASIGPFRRGEVNAEAYLLALAVVLSSGAAVVHALAEITQSSATGTWKTIRPLLLQ
jgi:hypothetical protein